eukprot:TRINITY_DN30560_c0_g1_i1.p1 TRINITY_DN30560_c0_g1~~TRINITY_DN30560_c0_g1_i1.p1  ORF type:complete len:356 (+),score=99.31 TRINITY_DN30560_c0_g1_i1:63-1070(+)
MGKKKQARPGLDGIAPGAVPKAPSRKDRRVAERAGKKGKKKLMPGKPQKSELEKLRKERQGSIKKRQARRSELEKKGTLYNEKALQKETAEIPQPPYRTNVSVRKMILFYEVSLHKVPVEKIKVHSTPTRFTVDTLEFSKQWVLNVPHPDGIVVTDEEGLAEITPDGILKVKLKIKTLPEAVKAKELSKQKSIEDVRNLRFRRNQAGELITGKRKITIVKEKETEKADGEPKKKKRKTFVTDKDAALELIAGIQQEEEPKKEQRKTMLDHATDMKADRKERRQQKRAKKQTLETQAIKQIVKSKKAKQQRDHVKSLAEVTPLKEPTGRKVRFSTK